MKKLSKISNSTALLVFFASLVLFNIFVWNGIKLSILDETKNYLGNQVGLAKIYAKPEDYIKKNYSKLKESADNISRVTGLRSSLVAKDGEVLADSELDITELSGVENHINRPEIQESFSAGSGFSIRRSATVDKDLLYYCENVYDNNRIVGFIRLAMFAVSFDRQMSNITKLLIWANVFLIVVLVAFTIRYSRFISKQFSALSRSISFKQDFVNLKHLPNLKYEELNEIIRNVDSILSEANHRNNNLNDDKNQLLGIFNSLNEGIAAFDEEGRLLFFNNSFCKIMEINVELIPRLYFYDFILFTPLINDISEFLKNPRKINRRTKYFHDTYIEYQLNEFVVFGSRNTGFVLSVEDMTAIRKVEIMRRDFVANVSHEFKTPLTSIKGFAETLLSSKMNNSEIQQKFLTKIQVQASKLENIVNDLLQLSRIQKNEIEKLGKIDPSSILKEIAAEYKLLAESKKLKFEHKILESEPRFFILANDNLIKVIFSNLLTNAINYNRPNGSIRFESKVEKDTFIVKVTDTGFGIPEKETPRVFERFYRVDSLRDAYPEGTGLGLSIVKNTTEQLNGKVELFSRKDEGSTFTISFPLI